MVRIVSSRPIARLLTTWTLLSGFVGVVTSLWVLGVDGAFVGGLLLVGALFVAGGVLGWRTHRPVSVPIAVVLVVWGALDVVKGCPAVGCSVPAGYEYWRHVRVFGWHSPTGPALGVTAEPDPCGTVCPYTVELVPLALGYALFGEAVVNGGPDGGADQ